MTKLFDIDETPVETGKSNEWYTPSVYIEAAREVMYGIDLDPASCELANRTVRATRYYTKDDDGLSKPWHGRVWLNPPFLKVQNKSGIALFVDRLVSEYQRGNVTQAVLLGTSDCDASWFHQLWAYIICFPDHNVYFNRPNAYGFIEKEARHGHWFGTVFVYLGPHEQRFIDVFSRFGRIAKAIDTPPTKPTMRELWEVACD